MNTDFRGPGDGRILSIDLTTGVASVEAVPEARRRELGGCGSLAAWLLLSNTEPDLDPRDPASQLVLAGGACVGTRAVALSRCAVAAKSHVSGGLVESMVEGPFAHGLSGLDLDALVVSGQAPAWSYLLVTAEAATVVECRELVGFDTGEITDRLLARHGGDAHVATIGPAGVAGMDIASIVLDRSFPSRAGGLGSVMAAKRLLAIVLADGAEAPRTVADPMLVGSITCSYEAAMPANPLATSQRQAPGFGFWVAPDLEGYLGVENYRTAVATLPSDLPTLYAELIVEHDGACPSCPQNCLKSVGGVDPRASYVHQEAVQAFTTNLGLADIGLALEVNCRCHLLGIEHVALSAAIAALLDAAEAAHLPAELADIAAKFGDLDLHTVIDDLMAGRGSWAQVALGVGGLGDRYPSLREHTLHVHGVPMVAFDPRGSWGQAVVQALNPSGPRYDAVEHDLDFDPVWGRPEFIAGASTSGVPEGGWPMASCSPEKAVATARLWALWSGYDALGVCLFAAPPTRPLTEESVCQLVQAVTGWDVTPAEVIAIGERRLALQRLYNLREGVSPAADTLPDRFFDLPVDGGRLAGAVLDRESFAAACAGVRGALGWSESGGPTTYTLNRLGIAEPFAYATPT